MTSLHKVLPKVYMRHYVYVGMFTNVYMEQYTVHVVGSLHGTSGDTLTNVYRTQFDGCCNSV